MSKLEISGTNRCIHENGETIEWYTESGKSGTIKITPNENGGYFFDAQYLSLDDLFCVIRRTHVICEE